VATTAISSRGAAPTAATLGENAQRFLDRTGDADGGSAAEASKASGSASDGEQAGAIEGQYMPNGFRLTPAGTQVPVFNFPLGLSPAGDGSHVIVSSDSGGLQGLSTVDAAALTPTYTPADNLFIGVAATPDGRVYASGGNADRVFRLRLAGPTLVHEDLTEAEPFPLHNILHTPERNGAPASPVGDGIPVKGYPGASVLDGDLLYVAGTLSEPTGTGADACPGAQAACGRVSVIDTTTNKVVRRIPVGLDAYALALDAPRHILYVANWADEAGRGQGLGAPHEGGSGPGALDVGTVSRVDISDPATAHEIDFTPVGHHPTALQLNGDRLFVANTNDDTITVLRVGAEGALTKARVESVQPHSGAQVGAHPDAFALSPDGGTLFVALAGLNAVEVRDGHTGAPLGHDPVYIPTGWYPSALLVTGTQDAYRLWVANAKGEGAATGKGSGMNLSIGGDGNPLTGTVSVIDLPDAAHEAGWTSQVVKNDHLGDFEVDPCDPGSGITVSEVLCPPSGESPIKHVLYIVTENKTFDQYFGDMDPAAYDADPTYLLYGQPVTPNHHAMAAKYSLSDRFFSDAQVSVTGHSWTSGAVATDHNEKTFQADYDQGLRGSHGNGDPLRPGVGAGAVGDAENELNDPEGGYLFEAFKDAGAVPPADAGPHKLSMAIYGESTARESGGMTAYKAPGWKDGDIQYFDTCRAHQFIDGSVPDGPGPNSPDQVQDCGGRTLPPQFTLKHWTDELNATGVDTMPSFLYMSLPVNHTLGTNLGSPTPASMVADNDYAIGLITEALSNSPFWGSTVIMQTEDDTQAAGDHISPLRDYLQVSGPLAKPGANHQWGSMGSLLRTIEQIFDVPPVSLFDRLALPQHDAFQTTLTPFAANDPRLAPYKAIKPLVPFALNQPGAVGQAESASMDFSTYDLIDEQLLNAILYADARGTPLQHASR
jgi:DNA-binding beta-propeller fold protein YncE